MKINSVYAGGGKDGMERLAARLKDLFGFPVDGYVLVDLEAFQKTVDLVGGVEFDVPMDMNYEDPSQNLYIHLQKGLQTLDGEQAMASSASARATLHRTSSAPRPSSSSSRRWPSSACPSAA